MSENMFTLEEAKEQLQKEQQEKAAKHKEFNEKLQALVQEYGAGLAVDPKSTLDNPQIITCLLYTSPSPRDRG